MIGDVPDHFFLELIQARLALPEIKDFLQPTDDGAVAVTILVLEAKEFAQFLQGGLHGMILSCGLIKDLRGL